MTCKRRLVAKSVRMLGGALLAAAAALATAEEASVDYARLMADADSLERYNAQRARILESQQAEIATLETQIAGLAETGLSVQPLLQRMFDALSQFVAGDLPFLSEERQERIDRLEEIMASENSIAEKFRRLMEAYRIELEYGRVMEAYRGKLPDGRDAQFVHIGRVTLLYRTTDGSEAGYWDAEAGQWVADSSYFRAISDAIAMANEEVTPDLLAVPVPAAAENRS